MKSLFYKLLLILLLGFSFIAHGKRSNEKVVLALKWKHQFQFAGYYAAIEKGYYTEAGLDVELIEGSPETSPVNMVLQGESNFGIGNIELITHFLKGDPVVLLASIFQHSPNVIIVKESSDIYTPHDLVNKSIMLETDERGFEILGMLYMEGFSKEQLKIVDHTYSINDFLTNKVDALSAYTTNEPYFLESFGIPYRLISPKAYGIDFYSDCLFTSKDEIRKNPERVDRFRDATIKGWEYALNNKEEIATLILSKYNSVKSYQQLIYEANAIHKLINPEMVEIGHSNRGRWESMAGFLYQNGFVDSPRSIDNFLYDIEYHYSIDWRRIFNIALFSLIAIVLLGILLFIRVKKIVEKRTRDIKLLVSRLEEQNKQITSINKELISAREAAEESLKDKSTFFAGLTAELKFPVNSLLKLTKQFKPNEIPPDQFINLTQEIQNCSRTLNNFTKDVVAIFSIETSKERIAYGVIDPTTFLDQYAKCGLERSSLNPEKLKLNLPSPQLSYSVLVDKEKIERIFDILIQNSLKHSPGSSIEIGYCQQETDTLTFWAKDNGKGLSQDQVEQFNHFFADANRYFFKGIGYGLTLVKALVNLMGGSLWVNSHNTDGTTFNFKLPYIQLDTLPFNQSIVESLDFFKSKKEIEIIKNSIILVHEHHANKYLLIRSMLEGLGCTLVFSERLDLTLNISMGYPNINLVLMNVSVLSNPEIDAIQKIREHQPKLPIIANVTYEIDEKEKYLELGFNDVIQGSITRKQLVSKFLEHFNSRIEQQG